jgi:hypothetical protein
MQLRKIRPGSRSSRVALVVLLCCLAALAASAVPATGATRSGVVVVTHDGQYGWQSRVTDGVGNPDPSYGSVTWVTGPGTPPRGSGSLEMMTNTGKGDGSAQIRNSNYGGVLLSSLTELSYWAYHHTVATSTNQQQWPYLSLEVSCSGCSGGSTANSDRLFFEPPYQQPGTGGPTCSIPGQQPTTTDTWQQWDALNGCWWDNGGQLGYGGTLTSPLSNFIALHPDATIVNPNGLGGLRLAVGYASPTDQFDGNIDMVTVGVNGSSTSYDFEHSTCREADGHGHYKGHDGNGQGDFSFHHGCREGDDDVHSSDRGDGKDFHSTRVDSVQYDGAANTMTVTGVGLAGGVPVSFVFVALETGPTTPGWVSFTFSDGYSVAGTLLDGSVLLH